MNDENVLTLASEAGRIMLENGAEISRVEETMDRISGHYGITARNFFVLSNGIFTTGKAYANAEFIPIKGCQLEKVVEVNQLSRDICEGKCESVDEAKARLCAIRSRAPKPAWEQILGSALGSGGFCAIFGGGLADCGVSFVVGALLYLFVLFVSAPHMSKILGNILGGAVASALCILFYSVGLGDSLANIIIGAIIPLIPGVQFTNGIRDVANEDYIAGATRLMDAVMVFFCIALGVMLTFALHSLLPGGMIELHGTVTDGITATFALQMVAAFVGTAAFAVLFGVPRRHYAATGLVGMIGWAVYLLVVRHSALGGIGGTFFATIVVFVVSRLMAVVRKTPLTVFLICGIFPLIPGAGVFWTAYYIVSTQGMLARGAGIAAIQVAVAIVLGIVVADSFHYDWMGRILKK